MPRQISLRRRAAFALIPLLVLCLLAEIGLRTALYQYRSRYLLATGEVYDKVQHTLATQLAQLRLGALDVPNGTREALYTEAGRQLLREFQARYETDFEQLVRETEAVGSRLLVVYLPSDDFHSKKHEMDMNRAFFSRLTDKYDIPYVDVTERFLEYPSKAVTLLPDDNHLSRFGNTIVAQELGQAVSDLFSGYRSDVRFAERPRLLGDFRPNDDSIWTLVPTLPYHVRINSQGLRMSHDLTFPKTKQRVLVLGDSVTFGVFLHNHDTYPAMLNAMYPGREFVNAGVQGYTILQELSLFKERAKYVEPDVTILQVLDNDLYDYYYFRLNMFDRQRKSHSPTDVERVLLDRLRENR